MDTDALKRDHAAVHETADQHVAACHRLHEHVRRLLDDEGVRAVVLADALGVHVQRIYAYAREARGREQAAA